MPAATSGAQDACCGPSTTRSMTPVKYSSLEASRLRPQRTMPSEGEAASDRRTRSRWRVNASVTVRPSESTARRVHPMPAAAAGALTRLGGNGKRPAVVSTNRPSMRRPGEAPATGRRCANGNVSVAPAVCAAGRTVTMAATEAVQETKVTKRTVRDVMAYSAFRSSKFEVQS
jgi:hypothetical protein